MIEKYLEAHDQFVNGVFKENSNEYQIQLAAKVTYLLQWEPLNYVHYQMASNALYSKYNQSFPTHQDTQYLLDLNAFAVFNYRQNIKDQIDQIRQSQMVRMINLSITYSTNPFQRKKPIDNPCI
eukprot:NODE_222_length_12365_cov_0.759009.p5 type:complete len:124 gc:universal NODE_222_length_12365_cov_0.759009:3095-3466(+)